MIPSRLLQKLADDPRIPESSRLAFLRTLDMDRVWRSRRSEKRVHEEQVKASTRILVHDCEGQEILPGVAVDPMMSADATVQRAFRFTKKIAQFYLECLNRNSIDDAGKDLVSSVHFSQVYSNAYWSPSLMQMVYGDGDGFILLDFTLSPEFIAHEVAHGLTHFTADLDYVDQAGALNESVSDVLGTMCQSACKLDPISASKIDPPCDVEIRA